MMERCGKLYDGDKRCGWFVGHDTPCGPWNPLKDQTCVHGRALDVHCCECRRSGFARPKDCDCYEEQGHRYRRVGEVYYAGGKMWRRGVGIIYRAHACGGGIIYESFLRRERKRRGAAFVKMRMFTGLSRSRSSK